MGDTASDVKVHHDYRPNGSIITTIEVGGIDVTGIGSTGRATLSGASDGTDGEVRSALVSVLGGGMGRAWDDAPNQDSLHGSYVSGYVSVRTRIRSMMANLP